MLGISLIFGVVKNMLSRLFSDWRIIALILVVSLCGFGYFKYTQKSDQLANIEIELKNEKDANSVLRQDMSILQQNSNEKDVVIQQLTESKKLSEQTISRLIESQRTVEKRLSDAKKTIDSITVAPSTNVGPYLTEAINQLRGRQ